MLSKLTTAGTNGQFRTPRHIIKMMVEFMAPEPREIICDPACGTAVFLVAVAEYLQKKEDSQGNSIRTYAPTLWIGATTGGLPLQILDMDILRKSCSILNAPENREH